MQFIFEHISITHKVHIVPDDFQIPAHGIIGKDFLKKHKCQINYENMTFTVKPNNENQVTIAIRAEIMRGYFISKVKNFRV